MCGRELGSPTEEWRDHQASWAAMVPWHMWRNSHFWTLWKNNLKHQEKWKFPQVAHWVKNSSKRRLYSSQWKRARTGKKWLCFLLLGILNNETHRREGRVTGYRGWAEEGNQRGQYLEPSRSNFPHDWEYSVGPSVTATTTSERHLSRLSLSPPLSLLPSFLQNRCIMCD